MFNLIMRSFDWGTGRATMPINRFFEYTEEHISRRFRQDSNLLLEQLKILPCLFMHEGTTDELAYVGQINRAHLVGKEVAFEFSRDNEVPPIHNRLIYTNRMALDMHDELEFSRNHWAVKDVDIYRFLLRNVRPRRQRPTVFEIPEHENIEPSLASAMMPFDTKFNPVYESIKQAAGNANLQCIRADDIWEKPKIIEDVVALIDRSRVVVCDCTGRNPNVFYEAGIAHTLGRDVILITQSKEDIPFDLQQFRYIHYLNNTQGLSLLEKELQKRMQTILGH